MKDVLLHLSMVFFLTFLFLIDFAASKCQNGWVKHEHNCYFFSQNTNDWEGAFIKCIVLGGRLVEIEEKIENNFIAQHIQNDVFHISKRYWIGLSDVSVTGKWVWMTSQSQLTYSNWEQGQPSIRNHLKELEQCVHVFYSDAKWNDVICSKNYYYICEKLDEPVDIIG